MELVKDDKLFLAYRRGQCCALYDNSVHESVQWYDKAQLERFLAGYEYVRKAQYTGVDGEIFGRGVTSVIDNNSVELPPADYPYPMKYVELFAKGISHGIIIRRLRAMLQ